MLYPGLIQLILAEQELKLLQFHIQIIFINSNIILFPNPIYRNSPVTINLDNKSKVKVNIYNIQGELVKTIDYNSLDVY